VQVTYIPLDNYQKKPTYIPFPNYLPKILLHMESKEKMRNMAQPV
jgi:hypothetical protein